MAIEEIELAGERTDADGSRRYRPVAVQFDTRNAMLEQVIDDSWEPEIQQQWRTNQSNIRMELLAEHGTHDGELKIENYKSLGVMPWSIVYEHNDALTQVRSAFAHGDFFPALVGACALGERIFNHLIRDLRAEYVNHPKTTKRVRSRDTFDDWGSAIEVLHGWGVLSDDIRDRYLELEKLRHESVHFVPGTDVVAKARALEAIQLVQQIIEAIFAPLGGPPIFIAGTAGASFIALEAEQLPLVKRVFLPRSALVSPRHGMRPARTPTGEIVWQVIDDRAYDPAPLTDAAFASSLEYQ